MPSLLEFRPLWGNSIGRPVGSPREPVIHTFDFFVSLHKLLNKLLLGVLKCDDGYFEGLVQDCNNSIANAMELLQSCTKPSM